MTIQSCSNCIHIRNWRENKNKKSIKGIYNSDSVFIAVHWDRDRLEEVPEDLVDAYYESLMEVNFQTKGNTAIDMFRSNVEIRKTMAPLSVDAMESLPDIIQLSYDMISKVDSELGKIRSNIMEKYVVTGFNTPSEVTDAFSRIRKMAIC